MLGAVDDVIVPVAFSSRGHRHDVRARPRFGQGKALVALAAHARHQVSLALLFVAGEQNLGRPPDKMLQGKAGLAQFALHQSETGIAEAAAAHLFRHVGGKEPHLDRLLLDALAELVGHAVVTVDLLLVRPQLALHERAQGVHQHALLVAGLKVHRTSPPVS